MLEIAEACVQLPQPPRRSILFALWDGEEKGLLGSQHWLREPTVPLERVTLAINLDMVGRLGDRGLEIYGTRTSRGLRELVSRQNQGPLLSLRFPWQITDNSMSLLLSETFIHASSRARAREAAPTWIRVCPAT